MALVSPLHAQEGTDATLSDITVDGISIPGFRSDTETYTVDVAYSAATPTIVATATDPTATVTYSPDDDETAAEYQLSVGAGGSTTVTVTVTAADTIITKTYMVTVNRELPVVEIRYSGPANPIEGDDLVFTVERDAAVSETLEVPVEVRQSRGSMLDSSESGTRTVLIPSGQLSATLTVPTSSDDEWEVTATISALIPFNDDYIFDGTGSAGTDVLDDDFPDASAVLEVLPATVEEGGSVTASVTITTGSNSMPNEGGGTIRLSTADGTAANGTDYTAPTTAAGLLSFAASDFQPMDGHYQATKQVTIPIADNTASEGAETFTVSIEKATTGPMPTDTNITLATPTTLTVTILGEPVAGEAVLQGLTVSGSMSDLTLNPTFHRATESYTALAGYGDERVTVRTDAHPDDIVEFLDGDGNAITDADPDSMGRQVNLAVGEDKVIKVKVTASDPVATKTYTVTVTRPKPVVGIRYSGPANPKEGTDLVFTVERDAAVSETLEVTVVVRTRGWMVDASEKGSKNVEIADGQSSATLKVPTNDDETWETSTTVIMRIAPGDYTISSSAGARSVSVPDNDFPDARAMLEVLPATVEEGSSVTASVTVTTDFDQRPNEGGGTIRLSTADGTAANGTDYTAPTTAAGLLSFAASDFQPIGGHYQATKQVTIPIVNDTVSEDAETFTVSIEKATTGPMPTDANITLAEPKARTVSIDANIAPTVVDDHRNTHSRSVKFPTL